MADDQQDVYAARRAALEARFAALPPAGTPAYWQAIGRTDGPDALPYEVLARCYRERLARAANDAEQIFTGIVLRIQPSVRRWAAQVASRSYSGRRAELADDLEEVCYLQLWQELKHPDRHFILENFRATLRRIQQHVAQDVMRKAGQWQRPGVAQSARVPTSQIDSLLADGGADAGLSLVDWLEDPRAQQELEQVEFSDLLDLVQRLPESKRALIEDLYWRGRTQREIAEDRGVTERTIRNWLTATLREMGIRYRGGEEDDRG